MTLHDEEGLVAVMDHHLEDLAVLRAHQDVIPPPANTAHGQPCQKHISILLKIRFFYFLKHVNMEANRHDKENTDRRYK